MALPPADTLSTDQAHRHAESPPLVGAYLERGLPASALIPAQVHITQTGEMWSKPGGRLYWELPSGRFVYWRGHVTEVQLVDEAFAYGKH